MLCLALPYVVGVVRTCFTHNQLIPKTAFWLAHLGVMYVGGRGVYRLL